MSQKTIDISVILLSFLAVVMLAMLIDIKFPHHSKVLDAFIQSIGGMVVGLMICKTFRRKKGNDE